MLFFANMLHRRAGYFFKGCVARVHKAEQDRLQHVDPTVAWPSEELVPLRLQVPFDSDLLHDLVKCQYRITDFQTFCKKHGYSSLLWTIILFGALYHYTKNVPKKENASKSFCLEASFFFSGTFFTAPSFLSRQGLSYLRAFLQSERNSSSAAQDGASQNVRLTPARTRRCRAGNRCPSRR